VGGEGGSFAIAHSEVRGRDGFFDGSKEFLSFNFGGRAPVRKNYGGVVKKGRRGFSCAFSPKPRLRVSSPNSENRRRRRI